MEWSAGGRDGRENGDKRQIDFPRYLSSSSPPTFPCPTLSALLYLHRRNSIQDIHPISGFSILSKCTSCLIWCSLNPVLYHVNVAYGSPLFANFHTPPPTLVAITVDGWMAGDGRACMCWRLRRLLLLLRLRVHGIPITGEGKGKDGVN